jgi:hypothetical protein
MALKPGFCPANDSDMVPVMKNNPDRRTRSGPAIALALTFALLIGYPLSIGPAAMLYRLTDEPEFLGSAIDIVYRPLALLPEPLGNAIMDWANFCMDQVS